LTALSPATSTSLPASLLENAGREPHLLLATHRDARNKKGIAGNLDRR
jgi:hypothetical protein